VNVKKRLGLSWIRFDNRFGSKMDTIKIGNLFQDADNELARA